MTHNIDEPIRPDHDSYCKDIVKKVNRIVFNNYQDTLHVPEPSIGSKTTKSNILGMKSGIRNMMSRKAFLGLASDNESTGSKDLSFKKKTNPDLYRDLFHEANLIQGPTIIVL